MVDGGLGRLGVSGVVGCAGGGRLLVWRERAGLGCRRLAGGLVVGVVGVVGLVVLGGCGRDGRVGSEMTAVSVVPDRSVVGARSETTTVATTAVLSEEAKVLAAYEASWAAWLEANDPPDPHYPGIDRHFSGASRDRLLEQIRSNLELGLSFRRPEVSKFGVRAERVTIAGDVAELVGCVVDDGLVVDSASGAVINGRVVARNVRATLVLEEGEWKMADEVFLQEWTGAEFCGP